MNNREQKTEKQSLKVQLDRIELRLKSLTIWTTRIGVLTAIIGASLTMLNIWTWRYQNKLVKFQSEAEAQKQNVNIDLKLEAQSRPKNPREFDVVAHFKNNSARQVSVSMLSIRFWKDWSAGASPMTTPQKLVFSDNRVASCPPSICPKEGQKFRLASFENEVVLPSGESYELIYGPYEIPHDVTDGYWLEGFAFTREQDKGECTIAGPPLVEGALPQYCDKSKLNLKDCYLRDDCKFARSRATFQPIR